MKETIAERIHNRRRDLKMSMDELGVSMGFKTANRKTAVYHIESGGNRLRIERLPSTAAALKTSVYYLLGYINDADITDDEILSILNNHEQE